VPQVSINIDEQGGLKRGERDFVIENVRNPCGVGGRVLSGDVFVNGADLDPIRETLSIDLIDPSGNVLDASTGRPVEAARVRLEFSPVRRGPFGRRARVGTRPR
jgi:hypothetical protein